MMSEFMFSPSGKPTVVQDMEIKMPWIHYIVEKFTGLKEGAWVTDSGKLLVIYNRLYQVNILREHLETHLRLERSDIQYAEVAWCEWNFRNTSATPYDYAGLDAKSKGIKSVQQD